MNSSSKGIKNREDMEVDGAKVKNKPDKKKYDGQGLMLFEKQKKYMSKKTAPEKIERKKKKDRLRYLLKKEKNVVLSSSESKEKKYLGKNI